MKLNAKDIGVCFEPLEPRLLLSGSWGAGVDGPSPDPQASAHDGFTQETVVFSENTVGSGADALIQNQSVPESGALVDVLAQAPPLNVFAAAGPVPEAPSASDQTATVTGDTSSNGTEPIPDLKSDRTDEAGVRELVFISDNVADYEKLIADLQRGDDNRIIETVLLDSDLDGIAQVSEILSERSDLAAVHFITHGSDGQINLGSNSLNSATLQQNSDAVAGWGNALIENGDILFYGCNIAAGNDGQGLLNKISVLTGADVAASNDATGSDAQGGDWNLEYAAGSIETALAVSARTQQELSCVLAITVNSTSSAMTAGATSLAWSHTVNAGSNTALFVGISMENSGGQVNSITYGGTPMTLVGRATGTHTVEIWQLVAPIVGTADIVANFNSSRQVVAGAAAFAGVNQATPTGAAVFAAGTSATPTINVASAAGELVIDTLFANDGPTASLGAGQSAQWNLSTGSGNGTVRGAGSTEAGAASVTMSWNLSASIEWEIGAVSIKAAGNNAPTATNLSAPETYIEDTPRNLTDIVISDVDSASVTATLTLSDVAAGSLSMGTSGAVTSTYNAGSGVWTASGAIADVNSLLAGLTFTPALNFNSNFSIATSVSDGVAAPITGSKAMTGTAVNDAPVADDDFYSINEDASLVEPADGVLLNDADVDGDTINAVLVSGPSHAASFTLDADGSFSYTPEANWNGSDSFTYKANDGTTDGNVATVSIVVNPVNDAPTFGTGVGDGIVTTAVGASADVGRSVTAQPDGKILLAGYSWNGSNYDFALTRYNVDGTLDTSFSTDGKVTTSIGVGGAYGQSVAVQADGKILVGGYADGTAGFEYALARYNSDGSLDTSFAGDGIVTTSFGIGDAYGESLTLQADGKILVSGYFFNGAANLLSLARYNADGSLDTSFSGDGLLTTSFGGVDNYGSDVAVQSDGAIVVVGSSSAGGTPDFAVARYDSSGNLDMTFSGDGLLTTPIGAGIDQAYSVAIQDDGKLLVAGYSFNGTDNDLAIVRYNSNGTLDTSFGGGDGIVTTAVGAGNDAGYSVTVQADGKILVAGLSLIGGNNDFALVRYNSNGTLDTSFGGGDGIATTAVGAGNDGGYSVMVQADGKIVVAGTSNNGSNNDFAVVRYNSDGTLDNGFDSILANTLNGAPTFIENGVAVVLDADVQIFDAELSALDNFSGTTLTLARNGGANAQDVFSATGTLSALTQGGNLVVGGTAIGMVTTNSGGTLVLTFNASATNTLVNSAMQQIAYSNSSDTPPASVQIDWTFSDGNTGAQGTGGALSATGSTTVSITAINDAPELTGAGMYLTTITEDPTVNNGDLVSAIIARAGGDPITDADAGAVEGIAIISLSNSNGTWQYDTGSGWIDVGSVSVNSSLLLRDTDSLRFVPNADWNGTEFLTFAAWDRTSGVPGTKVDTSIFGGTSAFSTGFAIPSLSVSAINDDPAVTSLIGDVLNYTEGDGAVLLEQGGDASVSDVDSSNFAGGSLRVEVDSGLQPTEDVFSIRNQGSGAGQISVSGSDVSYEGAVIGTFVGGTGVTPLEVAFNGNATPVAITALVRNLTYENTNTTLPNETARSVTIDISDGDGGASQTQNLTINVTAANSTPTDILVTTTTNGGLSLNEDGGNDAYLQANASPFSGNNAVTIEVQFSSDSAAPGITTLFSYADPANQDELYFGIDATGQLLFRTSANGSAGYGSITTAPQLFDGQRHSVAVSWENSGGILMFYVDGEQLGLGRNDYQKTTTIDAGGIVVVGQHQGAPGSTFDSNDTFSGTIYSVRVFDDVRTVAEIAASYNSPLPYDEAGLLAQWTFDKLSVDGVITETVSGNNLTVQHTGEVGFTASSPELTFSVDENALDGTVVGVISGIDAEREAKIAELLAADSNLYYNAETGKFYKVDTGWHTPAEARTNAESTLLNGVNGQLVTIRSAAENEFVLNLANSLGNRIWIGATDATVEGEWRWIESGSEADQFWSGLEDGNAVNGAYQNWDPGVQPNQSGEEDWAEMDTSTGLWWDNKADAASHYVAEWKADDVLDTTDPLTYSIQSQTVAGAFALDADSGQITVADGSLLDFETNPSHSVTVRVTDVGGLTYDEAFTITLTDVIEVNIAPVALADSFTVDEGSTTTLNLASNDTDADDGLDLASITIVSGPTNGTIDAINADGTVDYTHNGSETISDSFTYTIDDASGTTSNTVAVSLTITPVNDAPTLSASSPFPAILEDAFTNTGMLVSDYANLSNDVDSGALKGIAITSLDNSNGTWQFTLDGSNWSDIGSVSINNALLLPSDAVSRFRFVPNPDYAGSSGALNYKAWDQTSGNAGNYVDVSSSGGSTAFSSGTNGAAVTVIAVNDAPIVDLNGSDGAGINFSTTFTEDGGAVSVTDVDAVISDVDDTTYLSLSVNLTGFSWDGANEHIIIGGYTFTYGSGIGDPVVCTVGSTNFSIDFDGSGFNVMRDGGGMMPVADLQTLMRGITYENISQNPTSGDRVINFIAQDALGLVGPIATSTISVVPENDTPAVTASAGTTVYTEQAAATVIDAGITLVDADGFDGVDLSDHYTAVVQITGNYEAADTLGFTNTANIQGVLAGDMLTLSVIGGQTATVADFEAALQSVTFYNGSDNPSEFDRSVSFSFDDGVDSSNIATKVVHITAVNDAPIITTVAPDVTFVEGGMPQVIDGLGTVVDVDSPNFDGGVLTVSITQNASADDRLAVHNFGTGPGEVGVSGNNVTYGGTIVGSFSGGTNGSDPLIVTFNTNAVQAAVQEVRANIQFYNVSDTPSTLTRQITFGLTDGDGGTATPQTKLVYVQAINDAPTIEASIADQNLAEDFASYTIDLNAAFADVETTDANLVYGVSGNTNINVSIVGGIATITPTADWNGSETLTFSATDEGALSVSQDVVFAVSAVADIADESAVPVAEDTPTVIVVLANDSFEGTPVVTATTAPTNGAVVINGDNTITYTPNADYTGADSFTYTVTSGGVTETATVTVTVTPSNDAPTIEASIADQNLAEDFASYTIDLNAAFADVETTDANLVYGVSGNTNINVSIVGGIATITPTADWNGSETLTFSATDEGALSVSQDVVFAVSAVADIADESAVPVAEDTPTVIVVLANDSFEGTPVVTATTAPTNGAVVINGDNTITYTPNADYTGADSFTYTVTSGGVTETATVTVTVTPSNDAPTIEASIADQNLAEDFASYTIDLNAAFADVETTDANLVYGVSGNTNINVSIVGGIATITPTADWNGSETLTFSATDEGALSVSQDVVFAVSAVADIADESAVPVAEDTPTVIVVLANDSFEGTPVVTATTAPTNGAVVINGDNTITYTPNADYTGADSFTYTVTSGGVTETATVTVTVTPSNDAPTIEASIADQNLAEDFASYTIDLNAAFADVETTDANLVYGVSGNTNINVSIVGGIATITPTADWNGSETLTFSATDEGALSVSQDVVFAVSAVADIADESAVPVAEDTPTVIVVLANDSFEGTPVVTATTAPTNGAVVINGDNTITYTPNADYTGADSFTYTVTSGGVTETATVTVTVTPSNDAPTIEASIADQNLAEDFASYTIDLNAAFADVETTDANLVYGVSGNTNINVSIVGGIATITPTADWNGSETLTFSATDEGALSVSQDVVFAVSAVADIADESAVPVAEDTPTVIVVLANDSFEGTPVVTATTAPTNGAVVINGDNTITYTPNADYTGADSFTYTVTSGGVTETATVTVTVTPSNDAPTIEASIADQNLAEDFASYTIDLNAAFADVETTDANLVYGVSGNTNINVSIVGGIATITPTADWNGSETLTFSATDEGALSVSQDVVFAVSAVADIADESAVPVAEDTPTVIVVLANDSFEGTPVVTATTAPTNGAVVINGDNTITYTPNADYTGADSFTYTVTSGGVTETATVTVTVTPSNDAPTIEASIADQNLAEDFASYTIDLNAAFADVETTDANLVYGVSGNTNINVSIVGGIATITPTADWNGSETLTFSATDEGALSVSQDVVFAVSAVADIADESAVPVAEDTPTVIVVLANDSFEGTPVVTATTAPTNGAVVINGDNTITYTPNADYTGADELYLYRDLRRCDRNRYGNGHCHAVQRCADNRGEHSGPESGRGLCQLHDRLECGLCRCGNHRCQPGVRRLGQHQYQCEHCRWDRHHHPDRGLERQRDAYL